MFTDVFSVCFADVPLLSEVIIIVIGVIETVQGINSEINSVTFYAFLCPFSSFWFEWFASLSFPFPLTTVLTLPDCLSDIFGSVFVFNISVVIQQNVIHCFWGVFFVLFFKSGLETERVIKCGNLQNYWHHSEK